MAAVTTVILMALVDMVTHTLGLDMVIHTPTHPTITLIHMDMDIPILPTHVVDTHIPTPVIPMLCYL